MADELDSFSGHTLLTANKQSGFNDKFDMTFRSHSETLNLDSVNRPVTGRPHYVLITAAHNEEDFIEKTILSVIAQTHRPLKWIVVNDGSNDKTRERVESKVQGYDFITLVNLERAGGRNFGRKILAFNRGLEEVQYLDYAFVGNLDADISVAPDYFGNILDEFAADRRLGLAGGIVYTKSGATFVTYDQTLDSIGGAVQVFRRQCMEDVGGYPVFEQGGEDAAVEITARMKGWKVRKFPENRAYEQRRTGTANTGILRSKVREGSRFYSLGYGFLFYALRCLYRLPERPLVLGSTAALFGYLKSMFQGLPVNLSGEVVSYLRAEQRKKLRQMAAAPFSIVLRKPMRPVSD